MSIQMLSFSELKHSKSKIYLFCDIFNEKFKTFDAIYDLSIELMNRSFQAQNAKDTVNFRHEHHRVYCVSCYISNSQSELSNA